ncbi:MAG: substrate-binding domain-containing protein [Oscillospiraceae bacterium]|nr:substrate-binding domain-containing protein [Oscillospiraceae bacterium]
MRKMLTIWVLAAFLSAAMGALAAVATAEGSWGHISEDLDRPAGWQRLVEESAFPLGARTPIGMAGDVALYEMGYGSYPSIDGSTVCVPMAMEFARQHLGFSDSDLQGFVFFSTTAHAYTHLIEKTPNGSAMLPSQSAAMDASRPVDLVLGTAPSEAQKAQAAAGGVELVVTPVCLDAFVFITHRDNPVQSLTIDQIRGIYSGQITNWREVGGADAEITAYVREANSGSQTAMEELVMQGAPIVAEPNMLETSMDGLVHRVGEYANSAGSIGYTYRYYVDALYPNAAIKTLAVEGIAPTDATIRSGDYPFSTPYCAVYRAEDAAGVAGQFTQWMLTEEGQRCIAQAGYVPLAGAADAEAAWSNPADHLSALPTVVLHSAEAPHQTMLRAQPHADAQALGSYPNGTNAALVSREGDWCLLRTGDGIEGYCPAAQVTDMEALTQTVPLTHARYRRYLDNDLSQPYHLYQYPLPDAPSMALPIVFEESLVVLDVFGGWLRVRTAQGEEGYIPCTMVEACTTGFPRELRGENTDVTSFAMIAYPDPAVSTPLYSAPDAQQPILARYYNGTQLEVLKSDPATAQTRGWLRVRVNGQEGYLQLRSIAYLWADEFSLWNGNG